MGPLTSQTQFSRIGAERCSLSVLDLNLLACRQMAYLNMSGKLTMLLMWRKRASGKWHKNLLHETPGSLDVPTPNPVNDLYTTGNPQTPVGNPWCFCFPFSLSFLTSFRCPKPQFPLVVQFLLYAPNFPNRVLISFISPLLPFLPFLGFFSAIV